MKRDLLKEGFDADMAADVADVIQKEGCEAGARWINAILRECLGEPVRVYGLFLSNGSHSWQDVPAGPQTHKGYVVCREKVEG